MINYDEEHPEVVRLMAKWMHEELIKTKKELKDLRAAKEAEKQVELFKDQLLIFRKMIFGRGSERISDRSRTEDQLLLHSHSLVPPIKEKQVEKLEEKFIEHGFTQEELKAESKTREIANPSADQWEEIPKFYDESTEVTVVERQYKLEKHRRKKWKLKSEFSPEKEVIITAPGPAKLIPGCTYSIDFAVSVVSDKYISHMPLERQTREMQSLGLKKIHTKTLYNLCMAAGVHLEPLAEKIRREILESGMCIHCDETPWPIQIKEQDDGYMWILANGTGSFYSFEPTRSGKVIERMVSEYKGPVLVDGYAGYNRLKAIDGITVAYCWAHARRKFTDIAENYPQEAEEILRIMGELFKIDRQAQTFAELEVLRREKSVKIIAEIKAWLEKPHEAARRGNHLQEAINYCVKHWAGLTLFLMDIRVPLTNNEAERTVRHAVMGRKNFYGSRTHNGADIAATLYTVIESCKKAEIDPRSFINQAVKLSARGEKVPTPLEYARLSRAN